MANYELSNLKYKGNTYIIKDNSALHQSAIGSWTPDFANLKPISTHEFDIASTSYFKICERPNVTTITDIADEVLAFRITVTGTNIFAVADVLVRMQPTVNMRPLVTVNYQTQSTSAGTTGIRYLRTVNPKAANTSYKYEIAVAAYNTTSRHIKVEVFKAPSAWVFSSAATTYSYNSTYQTAVDLTLYTYVGILYNYTFIGAANTASQATYKTTYDLVFNGQGNFLAAGAAIAANQFVFIGKDNKVYPTTSTAVEIDPAWPIVYCTSAYAAGAAIGWTAFRSWGYFTPASSILKDGTLVADDTVYMRCTYTSGKLYSANTMTQNLVPGNTYIKLGKMYSATAVSVNTYNSEYFTLDTDGHIKALNGYLFNAAKADTATTANAASTVSKASSTAAGTYGILFDSNPITSIIPTTTVPSVNAGLTFNPSTGNLSSTVFTGSGAGLTNIPLSGIQGGDELLPTKLLHVFHDLNNDTYSFTDSLTDSEIADILNSAFEGEINLNVELSDVDTVQLLKYYYPFNYVMLRVLMFETDPVKGIDQTAWTNNALPSYFAMAFMTGDPPTFQFIAISGTNLNTVAQQFAQALSGKEDLSNKVTSINSSSDNIQYPSAKAVYDAIHDNDLPTIDTYNGTSKIGYFAVRMLEDGSYTDRYILDDTTHSTANRALSYNRDTNSANADNGLGWGKRYKIGVKGGFNTNKTNERYIWGGVLRTPITLDHDTKAPLNSLIADGIKMRFRVYGTNQIADGTFIFFDTYVNVCYSASTGWSIYYICQGAKDYGAALTFENDYLQILVGPAASRKTFDEDYAVYKRYISMAVYLDHLGSNTSPAAYGDDYCNFIENTSNWAMSVRRGLPTEGWDDVVDQVYMDGWVEGISLGAKEYISNKVTTIDNTSTDDQYPSAKAVYTIKDTLSGWIQDLDEGKYNITGGDITGNVILKAAAATDSPALIFQRGTLSDNYNDWRIQDRGGFLRFDQRGNGSTSWSEIAQINTSGTISATSFSGSGASLTSLNASNISSGTLNAARLSTAAVYYGTCSSGQYQGIKIIDGIPANAKIQEGTMLHVNFSVLSSLAVSASVDLSINSTRYPVRTYMNYAGGYGTISSYAGAALNQREDVDFVFKTISDTLYAVALDVKADALKSIWSANNRNTNLNEMSYPINGLMYTIAASAVTAANGKPNINGVVRDSYVLALNWDNSRAYGAQLAIANGNSTEQGGIAYRRQKGVTDISANGWYDWKTVLDEDNVSKYVGEKTDAILAYTAAGVAFSNNALTIPIDGTQYKILQATVFNNDFNAGSLGYPALFSFNAAGSSGYIIGTTTYCVARSAASGITLEFDSSWSLLSSTSVDVQVLYRRIS